MRPNYFTFIGYLKTGGGGGAGRGASETPLDQPLSCGAQYIVHF